MKSRKEISMLGFTLVALAGDARSDLINALKHAKKGEISEAKDLVKSARNSINEAHNVQTKLLSEESGGEELDVTFIMVHGQDTLMTTMLLLDEMEIFIDLYERLFDFNRVK